MGRRARRQHLRDLLQKVVADQERAALERELEELQASIDRGERDREREAAAQASRAEAPTRRTTK